MIVFRRDGIKRMTETAETVKYCNRNLRPNEEEVKDKLLKRGAIGFSQIICYN